MRCWQSLKPFVLKKKDSLIFWVVDQVAWAPERIITLLRKAKQGFTAGSGASSETGKNEEGEETVYTESSLFSKSSLYWGILMDEVNRGKLHQRARVGFNSRDSCSALGPAPSKHRQPLRLFSLNNHHSICDVKEQRHKYFLKDHIQFGLLQFVCLFGVTEALDHLQLNNKLL